jgi:hypothetical protein
MTTYYQLDDYNQIIFDGLYGNLAENVSKIIHGLTEEINKVIAQTPPQTTPSFQKFSDNKYKKPAQSNTTVFNKRHKLSKQSTDVDWQTLRVPFKSTQIEKKEGIEKAVNDIRICLNKLSNKNYETQREGILELLKNIVVTPFNIENAESNVAFSLKNRDEVGDLNVKSCKQEDSEHSDEENEETVIEKDSNEIKRVATAIFDIASNNKFFSEIYATLYKDLIQHYSIFNDIIAPFIKTYKDSIYEIHYVDPNAEYDKFCEYNKKNDRRKALSAFITNLMKKEVIQKNLIIDIVVLFQELIANYIDQPNKTNEVEEITENIFILVTSSHVVCKDCPEWNTVIDNIVKCSQYKAKDKSSLSSRAIFKFMDILDTVKKL